MTVEEIKQQIDENNAKIESLIKTNFFTLNTQVACLLKNNELLQEQCDHVFENGKCKYCYKEEESHE